MIHDDTIYPQAVDRFQFNAVCINISLEDAEAGGGDHVCGEAPLCEGYYFLPRHGWAGLGG